MKKFNLLILLAILLINAASVAAEQAPEIISLYQGSKVIFDDDIGFTTHYYLADDSTQKAVDGKMRRQFCSAPEGVSAYEIIKNYEKAIAVKGGAIIHLSKNALRHSDKVTGARVWFMRDFFTNGRENRTNHFGYLELPRKAEDYVVGKISTDSFDIFISVAAAVVEKVTYYTLVTVTTEPMDMNNVTLNVLNEGIAGNGKVAIYDIYFGTGSYELTEQSVHALKTIADFLNNNSERQFLIVGHTDNTGSFDANIQLSKDRAGAVINKLVASYNVSKEQLKPYGVGSVAPVTTNSTVDGKARNRRVELVEQ